MKRRITFLIAVLLVLSLQLGGTGALAVEVRIPAAGSLSFEEFGSAPLPSPEVDPALTFTWDLLLEQNSMEMILSMYPAVRIYSKMYNTEDCTWIFLHGEDPVLLTDAYGSVFGQFKGCYFELAESTDGVIRPQINGLSDIAGSMENLTDFVLGYFSDPERLQLDRIEGDLIWADVYFAGGYRQKIAFDRGTLVVREIMSLSDGEVVGITGFDYDRKPTEYNFLDSWDGSLRNIQVLWETYPNRVRNLRRETVTIPMDWEYLPIEVQWGEFTAYTNDQYIGDYRYPGDGEEYLLFLTTVKG